MSRLVNLTREALHKQEGNCFYCGKGLSLAYTNYNHIPGNSATRGHWVPYSVWRKLTKNQQLEIVKEEWVPYGNTVAACSQCNRKKASTIPEPALTWIRLNTRLLEEVKKDEGLLNV